MQATTGRHICQVLMEQRGLTMDQLARLTGVSKMRVHQILHSRGRPSAHVVLRMAREFHVAETELLDEYGKWRYVEP